MDCQYSLFKYRFNGKTIAKSGNVFENVQRAISFNQKKEEWTKCRELQKKALEKKIKQRFMGALQKNNSTQTSGSVFAERIEKGKKTIFEWELIAFVDCFLDGHGYYDTKLVSFKIYSL